jgi:hypothetical protein
VPPNHRKAQYYRLILKETGFLSFSIIQALENLVPNLPKPPPPVRQTANSNINNNMSDISVNYNMNGAQMSGNNLPQAILMELIKHQSDHSRLPIQIPIFPAHQL